MIMLAPNWRQDWTFIIGATMGMTTVTGIPVILPENSSSGQACQIEIELKQFCLPNSWP